MKNKKNIIIVIGLIAIILVGILIGNLLIKTKNLKAKTSEEEIKSTSSTMLCQLKTDESDDYTTYLAEKFEVNDNRITSSTSSVIMICKNEEIFNELQNNEDFKIGRTFTKENLTIELVNEEKKDYTKDMDGEELNLNYDEYASDLQKIGYECKEN